MIVIRASSIVFDDHYVNKWLLFPLFRNLIEDVRTSRTDCQQILTHERNRHTEDNADETCNQCQDIHNIYLTKLENLAVLGNDCFFHISLGPHAKTLAPTSIVDVAADTFARWTNAELVVAGRKGCSYLQTTCSIYGSIIETNPAPIQPCS